MIENTELLNDSELFKTTFMEDNQNWNHSLLDSFPSPSSNEYPNDEEKITSSVKNNRVHSRHFSANDSQCIRNTAYLNTPTSSPPFLLRQQQQTCVVTDTDKKRVLRFDIILEAATAVTQKAEESAITYLNRGQTYGIQLNDKQCANEMITSTLSIAFHSSSHRRIAESYWKFWITQQKQTHARAIDLDVSQSTGISDVSFPSFDKITFTWNGSYGAKIFVRFKCLSTDFSRIKGVKGIPLRAQMESYINEKKEESDELTSTEAASTEICFCKVKLFRDKGAERKNKDDAKQISKQLEKVYGKANEQSLPLMYNVSLPYSVFGEIPTPNSMDSFEHATTEDLLALQQQQQNIKTPARYHTRVMTAPLYYRTNNSNGSTKKKGRKSISSILPPFSEQQQQQQQHNSDTPLVASNTPLPHAKSTTTDENEDFRQYLTQQQQALASLPHIDTNNLQHSSPLLMQHPITFDDTIPLPPPPPLTADALPTPCTAQATPTEFTHGDILFDKKYFYTPTTMTEYNSFNQQPILSSIYDIFTPEEIQQQPESCSITPTKEDFLGSSPITQKDYFCGSTNSNNFSLLQQQLQFHNQTASHIMSNNNTNAMFLLSPPIATSSDGRKKRKRTHTATTEGILTYSSNPSHLTLNSDLIKQEESMVGGFSLKEVHYPNHTILE